MGLYVGLMSGTSLDGIDALLCEISADGKPTTLAHRSHDFPDDLQQTLRTLCLPGDNEIEQLGRADRRLAFAYAEAVKALLKQAGVTPKDVAAIGCHGQTVRHRPTSTQQAENTAFTLQIGDPNTLASLTDIDVVADFRRRDIAEGGQGAPLAPALHQAVFASPKRDRAVVNIGGMANITLLPAQGPCIGFDTGPGNVLMDAWVQQQWARKFDDGGRLAATGTCHPELLKRLLENPYFSQSAGPRSTGREDFNADMLSQTLAEVGGDIDNRDVLATLLEFTAQTIASPLLSLKQRPSELYVCGGGAYNTVLMQRLEALLHPTIVASTDTLGVAPLHVEALAFAWLAWRRIESLSGNLPEVTGARREVILGAIYPA